MARMTLRVAVLGAYGAMGKAMSDAIDATEDLYVAARLGREDSRAALDGVDVALDLTHPDAVMANVAECLRRDVHVVVGTSGIDLDRQHRIEQMAGAHPEVGVLVVPNFSIGAVLMMRFAAEAAPYFESAEIIELHRANKPDAPSGTAVRTAELIDEARRAGHMAAPVDATTHMLPGARGAEVAGVPVHSVRLRGLLAHQEVLLGRAGEVLTLRHDSMDRSSFQAGMLMALRAVPYRPGLTVGLERILWPDR
jgi:4-hydroxy-tetrahydrodipicolinate reductase